MEVTCENINEVIPQVEKLLRKATFISVDLEMTGVYKKENPINYQDTLSQRFRKLREYAQAYFPIQFGLSIFRWRKEKKHYSSKTFVFYVFPSKVLMGDGDNLNDVHFEIQASSIKFLSEHGFDFNLLYSKGINCIKKSKEHVLRRSLSFHPRLDRGITLDKNIIKDTFNEIDIWVLCSTNRNSLKIHKPTLNEEEMMTLFAIVREKYIDTLLVTYPKEETTENIFLEINQPTPGELEIYKEDINDVQKIIDNAVGFRKIIDLIILSKKLIIGHNFLFDLCLIFHHFIEDIPKTVFEFQEKVHEYFPWILDTKTLSGSICSGIFRSYNLESTYLLAKNASNLVIQSEYQSEENKQLHNAGYDAFLTGCVVAYIFDYIENKKGQVRQIESPVNYLNKVFLYRHRLRNFEFNGTTLIVVFLSVASSKNLLKAFSLVGAATLVQSNSGKVYDEDHVVIRIDNCSVPPEQLHSLFRVSQKGERLHFHVSELNKKAATPLPEILQEMETQNILPIIEETKKAEPESRVLFEF